MAVRLGCRVFVDDDRRNVEALQALAGCAVVWWTPARRAEALAELQRRCGARSAASSHEA